jgi:glutamyl-tRNA(Gln) amidotransferase subunit D
MKDGDHIQFTYEGRELEGTIIQQKDGKATIKLASGYNILVPISDILDATTSASHATPKAELKIKTNPHLPKVTILHTGGTIASKVDYATGAVLAKFNPEELLAMYPELLQLANIQSRLLRNMSSDDMRFAHYNIMARAVLEEISNGAAGIIITHGTDTMHYTAAALSFALEGLNIPVLLVGSQRSSDRGSSDANTNLKAALTFITQAKAQGVFVAMHEGASDDSIAIIDGLHARKNHSSRRDAFASVNAPIVARVTSVLQILDEDRLALWRSRAVDRPVVRPFDEDLKVGLWKAHPQSFADELAVYEHYAGLVVEGTGLGHLPISEIDEFTAEHKKIRAEIGRIANKIPVVVATQTIFGRVNMQVYSPGRDLLELGVLGQGCDMAPEIAYVKLAWLLSHAPKGVREQFNTSLRGEISARSPLEDSHKGE